MWRICRKTIFPRWHVNRQNPVDNKTAQSSPCSKAVVLCPLSEKKNYKNNEKKQHADKKDRKCWDDPNFHFASYRSFILETAGWLGTAAALCINVHLKQFKQIFDHDNPFSSCIFSRNVLAMPRYASSSKDNKSLLSNPISVPFVLPIDENIHTDKVSSTDEIFKSIKVLADQYTGSVQNSLGLHSLNKNDKKAFRSFQEGARLGCSQAFYNLGLCYQLGKGTRVNLHRAAFCYRKAAIKGHGLASFNLAVFFMKGMGGLPVDTGTGKLLLAEAANKGVPEAQMYLGIELLEEGDYQKAAVIFEYLAKENFPDAQYYLGLCYKNGWGVRKCLKTALELFSKSADRGHEKAVFEHRRLTNEIEADCDNNHGFSLSLYQILCFRNNKRHVEDKTRQDVNHPALSSTQNDKFKQNFIHVSASVPELASSVKTFPQTNPKSPAPSYLDLMIPFFETKNNFFKAKTSFTIGDDTIAKDCSNSILPKPLSVIPQVTQVKT